MRYNQSKKAKETTNRLIDSQNDNSNGELYINDRIELNDASRFKQEMMDSLQQYIDQKQALKNLNFHLESD